MPRGNNPTNGRVFKPARQPTALTHPRAFAALEHKMNAPGDHNQPHQLNCHPAPPARVAGSKTLDDAQEGLLIQWIRQVKELFSLPTASQITTSASQILNRDGNDTKISQTWVNHFIKRLPDDLKPFKSRSSKKRRLEPSDLAILQHWFDRLEALIAGISPSNIYNFDETVFQIGRGNKPVMVLASNTEPVPCIRSNRTYCEWTTTMECIAADGWVAAPYVVIQSDRILDEWSAASGLPSGTTFNHTPNGRITEKAAWEWIQFFHHQTKDRAADGQPRLVLFRGQPQNLTFNFLQFREKHLIIPFCFPPNIGHLMQPFDVKPFQSYKDYWKRKYYRTPPDDADDEKTDFIAEFAPVREETLKPQVITDAFADNGIFPFNRYKKIQPLQAGPSNMPADWSHGEW
ncbi:uncharacterized protein N7498_000749 [Penicillium cinerascens]|uniref:HTH CENPB-type domain-containing protein n=1 Tax=Penicillium cinerascens TaxID=70096 RepID=A0A9W9NEX9_9EURO|nr:uncharacterized protein N7498_000749 [Penicillium cinerascens]KAJ5218650.1 hypothetical protein N7498_000749 [Penicillium cinerascens]